MTLNTVSKVSIGAAFAIVLLLGSLAGFAFARDNATYNQAPLNTYVESVDISGMTADEAKQAIGEYLASHGNTLMLHVVDEVTGTTVDVPFNAGISYDIDKAVETAIAYNHDTPALQRIINSATGTSSERHDIQLEFDLDASDLHGNIAAVAPSFHVEPVDASRDFNDDNTVTLHPEVIGRDLNVDSTYATAKDQIDAAVAGMSSVAELMSTDFTVSASIIETPPYLTIAEMPCSITVDYSQFMVYVFDGDQIIYACPCGYGCGYDAELNDKYDSPEGLHYINDKIYEPVWYNPEPNGWGKDLPAYLEGEESLLGLRALGVSDAPMIYLHGVRDYGLLGRRGSHGCINIANEDIVNIYDLIPELDTIKDEVWVYFHDYPGSYNATNALYQPGYDSAYAAFMSSHGYSY